MTTGIYLSGFALVLGALLGSFIFTTAQRLSRGLSLLPRSSCDHCGQVVSPLGLIPLLGWLWFRGRCPHCQGKIAILYPLFELTNGLLVLLLFFQLGPNPQFVVQVILLELLLLIALVDWRTMEVALGPLFLVLLVQAAWLILYDPLILQNSLIGLLGGAGGMYWVRSIYGFVRNREGLGEGDAGVMGMLGWLYGWQALLPILFVASIFGIIFGGGLLLFQKKPLNREIAFGPWLILAGLVIWFFQIPIDIF